MEKVSFVTKVQTNGLTTKSKTEEKNLTVADYPGSYANYLLAKSNISKLLPFSGYREEHGGKWFKHVAIENKWGETGEDLGLLRSDKFLKDRYVEAAIATEATNRVKGLTADKTIWPTTPKGWMVTSEYKGIQASGGLGVVAKELPESYNKTYGNTGAKLDIMMPLYRLKENKTGMVEDYAPAINIINNVFEEAKKNDRLKNAGEIQNIFAEYENLKNAKDEKPLTEYKKEFPNVSDETLLKLKNETEAGKKIQLINQAALLLENVKNYINSQDNDYKKQDATKALVGKINSTATYKDLRADHKLYTPPNAKAPIPLEKVYSFDVPVYNQAFKSNDNEKVDVYKSKDKISGAYIYMLDNPKYFNLPIKDGKEIEIYGWQDGIDESQRFMFLSKASSILMEKLKRDELDGKVSANIEAPNLIVANDWQASNMTSVNRLLSIAKKADATKEKDKEVYDYLYKTPVVTIVHNLEHKGRIAVGDGDKRGVKEKILNTLFEDYTAEIVENAKTLKNTEHDERSLTNVLLSEKQEINQVDASLHLSDYVVPVSENYSEELLKSEAMSDMFTKLLNLRKNNLTYEGITNGLSKAGNSPNQGFIDVRNEWLEKNGLIKDDEKLVSYDEKDLDKLVEAKTHNKKVYVNAIKGLIDASVNKAPVAEQVPVIEPENCSLEGIDLEQTPVITFVARAVTQKGFGILKNSIDKLMAEAKSADDIPVMVIDVSPGSEPACIDQIKQLKSELSKKYPEYSKRIIPVVKPDINPMFDPMTQLCGDYFMVPSRFEPCGLTQLEAMYRGTPAIVTSTGGLYNTVEDGKTGFTTNAFYDSKGQLLYSRDPEGTHNKQISGSDADVANGNLYASTIKRAVDLYKTNRPEYNKMMQNAMSVDYSWEQGSIQKYQSIFTGEKAVEKYNPEKTEKVRVERVEVPVDKIVEVPVDKPVEVAIKDKKSLNEFSEISPLFGELILDKSVNEINNFIDEINSKSEGLVPKIKERYMDLLNRTINEDWVINASINGKSFADFALENKGFPDKEIENMSIEQKVDALSNFSESDRSTIAERAAKARSVFTILNSYK